jgi:hypothetical protein
VTNTDAPSYASLIQRKAEDALAALSDTSDGHRDLVRVIDEPTRIGLIKVLENQSRNSMLGYSLTPHESDAVYMFLLRLR